MSRRRRDDWSLHALPGIRRAYRHALADSLDQWGDDALQQRLREMSASQERAARLADLYWVTMDMARVALDASTDVPDIDLADALPSHHGLIGFSRPLPPVPYLRPRGMMDASLITGGTAPTDGLLWRREGEHIIINALARKSGAQAGMPVYGPLADGATVVVPAGPAVLENLDPQARALGAFLHAMVTLMAIPTVAEIRDVDPSTGSTTGRPATPDLPRAESDVRVIDLRPMRHVRLEGAELAGGRTYRHRWVVRGHWRQQAHGPKRGQRRSTWIPSYVKGPDGAPLLEREDVMVWRR